MGRRLYSALAAALLAVMAGGGYREQKLKQKASPMCDYDWVRESDWWAWYFDCANPPAGGGGSGAGVADDEPVEKDDAPK